MRDFRRYKVWNEAHQLTLEIYRSTNDFPKSEAYGLTSQIRGSSASIGANIAEGCGRGSDAEFIRFLRIARGSASETFNHLLLAIDLGYLSAARYQLLHMRISQLEMMLTGLIRKIKDN